MYVLSNTDCEKDCVKNNNNKLRPTWKRKMNTLIEYFEQSFHVLTVVVVAEILRRIYRICHEYLRYSHHYEPQDKFLTIAKRSFGLNIPTAIGLIIFLFIAIIFIVSRNSRPPAYYFLFMPYYWLIMALAIYNSHLNYADWIRQPHGLDYAEGMASNYFHGYLKLILPDQTENNGLRQRIELYENKHKVKFAAKRLFILVPSAMFINSRIESNLLTKEAPLETMIKNRAGVTRPFKNDVYRLNKLFHNNNNNNSSHPGYYYIAMEGATPILSFFEAVNFQPSTTWQMKEMKREILLKFCKHLKYLLNKWPETQGRAEVILFNSYRSDGRPQDVGEVVASHIENMFNEGISDF